MVLEIANLEIKEGQNAAFEAALEKAQNVINQSPGYLSHEFQQCMEQPQEYVLLIQWESLEAHEVGFRKSELYKEWRGLIGEFFATKPVVKHYEVRFKK